MSDIVDKVVDNKLLIVVQRAVMFLLPFVIAGAVGFFSGQSNAIEKLTETVSSINTRVVVMENRDPLVTARRDDQLGRMQEQIDLLTAQLDRATAQNNQILQSLARLEALAK